MRAVRAAGASSYGVVGLDGASSTSRLGLFAQPPAGDSTDYLPPVSVLRSLRRTVLPVVRGDGAAVSPMLLLRGARQLVTLRGSAPRRGGGHRELGLIRDGALLINGGVIEEVGSTARLSNLTKAKGARVIDVGGKVVVPGFVDCHTYLAFGSPALDQFEMRLTGAPMDPLARMRTGPSIGSLSSAAVRRRSERWLQMAAAHGVTTSEVRCRGEAEDRVALKALRAVRRLDGAPQELGAVLTFEAHGRRPGEDAESLAERANRVFRQCLERGRLAYACEADCTVEGADLDAAAGLLDLGRRQGFALKVQGDRFRRDGGSRLAVEKGALSVDHAIHLDEDDIDRLADSKTVAVLLPGVAYHAGLGDYPPARRLLDSGAAVALATGFGRDQSPTLSMSMVLSLACRQMRMMPEEAITAATINAAAAMGRAGRIGSLEPGKQADVAVFDVSDYREIPYYLGLNLCVLTLKQGRPIYPQRLQPAVRAVSRPLERVVRT